MLEIETAPLPLSAFFDNSETAVYVAFDKPLQMPGASIAGTFTVHTVPRRYGAGAITLPGGVGTSEVRIACVNMVVVAGLGVIDYDATLSTLVGTNGLAVASFTGFPCPAIP